MNKKKSWSRSNDKKDKIILQEKEKNKRLLSGNRLEFKGLES